MRPFICRFALIIVVFCALTARETAAQTQASYLQLSPTVKAVL